MNLILDGICLALMGMTAFGAYRRGFVKTVLQFLSVLISSVFAFVVSGRLTPALSERFVYPMISGTLDQYIDGAGALTAADGSKGEILSAAGGIISGVAMIFADLVEQQISMSFAEMITRMILLVGFFILFSLLFNLIIFAADTIFSLPVLKTVNRAAGLGIGILQGFILWGLFCVVLSFLVVMLQNAKEAAITRADIENTVVVRSIYDSPIITPFLFQ